MRARLVGTLCVLGLLASGGVLGYRLLATRKDLSRTKSQLLTLQQQIKALEGRLQGEPAFVLPALPAGTELVAQVKKVVQDSGARLELATPDPQVRPGEAHLASVDILGVQAVVRGTYGQFVRLFEEVSRVGTWTVERAAIAPDPTGKLRMDLSLAALGRRKEASPK